MSELGRKISSHLKRPNWFTVPDCLLKIVLGEMSILITKGQHVRPTVLLENGYTFKHTEIGEVIKNLY